MCLMFGFRLERGNLLFELIKTNSMECTHEFTMCRLCLSESESFIDIFHVNEWFGYVAAEVIRDLLQFQVSEMDGFPRVVCSTCLGKLTDFKQFKEKCQVSRDTYSNVFAPDESHAEHPIDIEEPLKLEPKDPLDTQEGQEEEEDRPVKLEPKDPLDTQEVQQEMRKSSIPLTPLDYLELRQKRTYCESSGPYENRSNGVNDGGKLLSKRRKKEEVDDNLREDIESSRSAKVIVGNVDVKVRRDCKSPDDVKTAESVVLESRGEVMERREEGHCVDASVDSALEDKDTLRIKLESVIDGERERGEEAPLEVEEREKEHFRCNDCDKDFDEKEALIRHLAVHGYLVNWESSGGERESQVNADVNCGSTRNTNEVYNKGLGGKMSGKVKRDQAVRKYVCESCGKGFKWISYLKRHLRTHSGEKPFVCTVCDKRFGDTSNLKVHKLTHTGEKPYNCKVCCKRFTQNSNLVSHMRIHSGEKPFECKVCNKRFRVNYFLINHLRVHTQEKPFACKVCNKRFGCGSTLRTHTKIHSPEKPYVCRVCEKRFGCSAGLRHHLKIHSREKPHSCQICKKRFNDKSNLGKHLKIHSR